MKVHVVGSSCTWYSRLNTSFILDDNTLFDVPEGSYKTIIKTIDIFKLNTIFITHFHSDHFFGMHVLATRFMREGKKRGMKEKLKVFGPKGTLDKLVEINKALFSGPDECDKASLQEMIDFIEVGDGDEFDNNGYHVKVFALDHGAVYSQGYSFEDKNGQIIVFSGDTRECDRLHDLLNGADVAFLEMAAMKESPSHIDVNSFVKITKQYPKCNFFPIHTPDETLEFAEKNGLNVVNDGDDYIF